MAMSSKKCCVPGCEDSEGVRETLHLFPDPDKDRQRFNAWVLNIGGDIIGLDAADIYKRRRVCHRHFEEKYCCRYSRISNIAVPLLNLPGPTSLPMFTLTERRPLRQIQNSAIAPVENAEWLFGVQPSTSTGFTGPGLIPELQNATCAGSAPEIFDLGPSISVDPVVPIEDNNGNRDPDVIMQTVQNQEMAVTRKRVHPDRTIASKRIRKNIIVTPTEQALHKKLVQLRIKVCKYRSQNRKQAAGLKAAKRIATNPAFLKTIENFTSSAKILTMMQFREAKKKDKGRRFELHEKIVALSIMKQSPKGYRFLRKIFVLPAPQTLLRLVSKANIQPGINENLFQQIKKTADKMKVEERLCVLLFDEMALKANLAYNEKKDKVVGFVTDGRHSKLEFADHAQVFMIRGLMKNYKQPVAYTFSAAATKGPELAIQVKEVIKELQKAGMIVVATVCDQGSNNVNAVKSLIQETRGDFLRKGKTPLTHSFEIDGQEIVPLYDPPHLLKCIRNNLITKNLRYKIGSDTRIAKWIHIDMLHKENPGYKGIRLVPKLTDNHVVPSKIAKMKVKFASQLFSRTVATNMGYLADKGIIPQECKETADVLLFFDNLFDSVNGSYAKKSKHAKPLLGPVKPRSIHHRTWIESRKILNTMEFINTKLKVENVPTLRNWVWTLEGIELLLKNMEQKYRVTSVWMRHLNQDPIENFFGAIRSHGCRNVNPTSEKFESAFTTLLVNSLSSVHAPGTNCETDSCSALHALIISDNCKASSSCQIENIPVVSLTPIEEKSDPRVIGALQYVSGYFVRSVQKRIFKNCNRCKLDFMTQHEPEYLRYREYSTGKQWLCSPSESVLNCVSNLQDINNCMIKENLQTAHIKEFIKTIILMFIDFDFVQCQEHKDQLIDYLINLSCRFFIYNYCKDINRILTGKRDIDDDEDLLKIKAKKYFHKCFKRRHT